MGRGYSTRRVWGSRLRFLGERHKLLNEAWPKTDLVHFELERMHLMKGIWPIGRPINFFNT